jgi:sulfatase maturation enzyme AslB (radical SAM superfamily)
MTDTYCPLPWIGLNIIPGQIQPCCHWEGTPIPLEQIREDMLAGRELTGCSQCYFAEKIGGSSKRLEAIEKYGIVEDVSTQLLEVTFDNVCNLKCRGCCSPTSHMWRADEVEIYGEPFIDTKYIESDISIDTSNLKQIDISGGEPFLSRNVDRFIQRLSNINEIELGIVTSGYTRPSDLMFKTMATAGRLYLTISIDAIGELNDYFRSGSKFETVLDNVEYLNKLCDDYHKIIIHSTVSIYNVTYIKEVEEYFNKQYPHFKVQHRVLQWPEQLAIQHMPTELKDIVRPVVESFGTNYTDVLNAINLPGKDVYGHFINFHNSLDILRNESLETVNPLLFEYIKTHNHTPTDSKVFFLKQMDALK